MPIPPEILHIFTTYRRIRNEVIRELGNSEDAYLMEKEEPPYLEGPNHYYGKTTSGFVLEYYYGAPHKVHTPEGEYTYFRGNCMGMPRVLRDEVDTRLTKELGLAQGREQRYTTGPCGGEVGPYYRIVGTESFIVPLVSSPMLDGLAPDSNDKLNAIAAFFGLSRKRIDARL